MPSSTTLPKASTSTSSYIPNETCDPVPNNLVRNGKFACGLDPWVMNPWQLAYVGVSPGGFEYSGAGGYVPHGAYQPASVSQQIAVTPGQAYILTFSTYFSSCNGQSEIDVSFGDGSSGPTVTDCLFDVGKTHVNTATYVASGSTANLMFAFIDTTYYSGGGVTMTVSDGMFLSSALPSCKAQRG